jgi:mono/diheme cytochrome c family protein
MKKVFALSVFIVLITVACHKKAVPVASTPAPPAPVETPAVAAVDPALVEAGKAVFTTKCTKCHPAKVVENYTAERWTGILEKMIPKAKLDETEAAQVTAYVNANAKK